jgi:Bifunctional DNA primase/polymerase, N-terminal
VTGPFAAAARDLRSRGLAVLPCPAGKSPRGAYRFGHMRRPPGAKFLEQMIAEHGNDNVGVITDLSRRKLTVVDVDDPGDNLQVDMVRRFGDTPLAERTPSGGLHLYYRYNGEASANLRKPEGLPVEIKSASSRLVVVVAPSRRLSDGAPYRFLWGGWDDLDRLPTVKHGALRLVDDPALPPQRRIQEGTRADDVWRYCMRVIPGCRDFDELLYRARVWAAENLDMAGSTHRLTDSEIVRAARSAWEYEQRGDNLFGRGGSTLIPNEPISALRGEPDALALYVVLRQHHRPDAEFVLANAMARTFGWSTWKFTRVVRCLADQNLILCTHSGGSRPGDPPRYRFGRAASAATHIFDGSGN